MEKEILSKINGIKANFKCEKCGNIQDVNIFPYINFNENPEYYALVKELDVFKITCDNCNTDAIVKYDALYLNEKEKYFIYLLTDKDLVQKFRHQITYFIETVLNKDEKYNFDEFKTRLVFNTNQLVEKLAIFEIGLNDKVIEIIKYGFYENNLIDTTRFDSVYFDGIKETKLEFVLFSSENKEDIDKIYIDIEFYNQVIDKISKLNDENFIFPNIDEEWVKIKIEK
jgi:hypothetical protein